ncbi:MAG: TIGR03936 family radical SAM-associated protein [Bacillota bacterium]
MIVWVRFSKQGPVRYISHLDFARTIERALRRAGVPVEFTQGFNPHMKVSFLDAVPLGMESQAEWAQIRLASPVSLSDMLSRLNTCLPTGIRALEAIQVPEGSRGRVALRAISYQAQVRLSRMPDQGITRLVTQWLSQDAITVKKGENLIDVKGLLLRVDCRYQPEEGKFVMDVTVAGTSVRPEALMKSLDQLCQGCLDMETLEVQKLEVHW